MAGRARVARLFAGLFTKFTGDVEISAAEVNGEPGVLAFSGNSLLGVLVLEIGGEQVSGLRAVANPDKLGFLARQAVGLSHSGGPSGS